MATDLANPTSVTYSPAGTPVAVAQNPFGGLLRSAPFLPPPTPIQSPFTVPQAPVQPGSVTLPNGQTINYGGALTPQPMLPPSQPHGVLGFFENALHDLSGMATGLGSFAGSAFHDIAKAATLGTLGGGWETWDMLRMMPEAIKQDYLSRYGSFSKFVTGLYQHPLSFLTDLTTVATLGGGAAVKGAELLASGTEAAGEIGKVADAARAAEALKANTAFRDTAMAAGDTEKAARFGANVDRAGKALDTLGYSRDMDPAELWAKLAPVQTPGGGFAPGPMQEGLPPWTQRILPGYGSNTPAGFAYQRIGGELVQKPLPLNPYKSLIQTKVWQPLTTAPVSKFEAGTVLGQSKEAADIEKVLTQAHQLGLERIERPQVSNLRFKSLVDNIFGQSGSQAYASRNQMQQSLLGEARDTGVLTKENAEGFAKLAQDFQGFDPEAMGHLGVGAEEMAAPDRQAVEGRLARAIQDSAKAPVTTEVIPVGHQPFDVHVPGEWGPKAPPVLSPADLAANEATADKNAMLAGKVQALKDAGHDVMGSYLDGALPIVRVGVRNWGELQDTVSRMAGVEGAVKGVDNLLLNPRELMDRAVHVYHQAPDGTVMRVEVHTPLSARASDAARFTREWAQNIPEQIAGLKKAAEEAKRTGTTLPEEFSPEALAELQANYDKAVARHASLMEPVVQELRQHLNGEAFTANQLFRERMRLWVEEHMTVPEMRQDRLSPAQAFDREYLPMRLASGADYNFANNAFEGGADTMALHHARQAAGLPTPVYFPHMEVNRGRYSDYLMSRRLIGANRAAQANYLKRNEGVLFKGERYVTDPIEAYSRRASRAIMHQATFNFTRELVNRFARGPLSAEDLKALDPAKERLLAPDGMLRMFRGKVFIDDAIQKYLGKGLNEDDAARAALKDLLPDIQHEVVQSFTGVRRADPIYAVPKLVADRAEAQLRPTFGPRMRLFVDTPTRLWRNAVLLGSPRFLVRHFFGHIVFLKAQGGRFSDILRQLSPSFRRMLDEVIPNEALGGFYSGAAGMEQYLPKLGSAGENTTIGNLMTAAERGGGVVARGTRRYVNFFRQANTEIERTLRRAGWLTAAERAASRENMTGALRSFWTSKNTLDRLQDVGMNPRLAEQATKEVNHFFGNYTNMKPWERNLVRPYIAPFWSFYKHIAKLMLTMPFTVPERFTLLRQFATVGNDFTGAYGNVPPWLRGAVAFAPGHQPGETEFLNPSSANPFAAVFKNPMSLLHPLIKTALEQAMGRNVDTGQPFSAPNVITPFGGNQAFAVDAQGHATPVEGVRPNVIEELFQSFPQYQLLESLLAGGKTYDTTTLLDLLQHKGVETTAPAYPGGPTAPKYPKSVTDILAPQLGFSTYSYNLARYQQSQAQQEAAAVLQFLRQQGLIPPAGQGQAATVPQIHF